MMVGKAEELRRDAGRIPLCRVQLLKRLAPSQ
jgi:hypothetical protein